MAQVGKRYISAGGAEFIVTRGGPGVLSDGEVPLRLREVGEALGELRDRPSMPLVQLGKRYRSADEALEVLVLKAGTCDLRYDGLPMQLLQPKVLPSAD